MRIKFRYILLVITGCSFLIPGVSEAQSILLNINYSQVPLKHGFDGKSELLFNNNVYNLPKLTGGSGFEILVGAGDQWRHYVYAAFKYSFNTYEAYYKNLYLGTAYQNSFGTVMRIYLNKTLPGKADKYLSPKIVNYVLFGVDICGLKVRNSHYIDSIPGTMDAASFSTLCLPLGLGVSFKPLPNWTIDIDGAYRLGFLYYVWGQSEKDSHEIAQNIWVGGFRLEAGVTCYFRNAGKKK